MPQEKKLIPELKSNFPVLIATQIRCEGSLYFVFSFLDCAIKIILIESFSYSVKKQFRLGFPVCATYYDSDSHTLYLGTIVGSICTFDMKDNKTLEYKSEECGSERPEILCMYVKRRRLYVWNLNSELFVYKIPELRVIERTSFGIEISAASCIKVSNFEFSACIAFNQNLPMILNEQKITTILKQKRFFQIEQLAEDEVLQIAQDPQQWVKVVTISKGKGKNQSLLTVYEIQKQQDGNYCLYPILKIGLEDMVNFVSVRREVVSISLPNLVLFMCLRQKRKMRKIISKDNKFVFEIGQGKEICFLICKGFTCYNVPKSMSEAAMIREL